MSGQPEHGKSAGWPEGVGSPASSRSRASILRCDGCGKFHLETPDFDICDCGTARMDWATEDELRKYFRENA